LFGSEQRRSICAELVERLPQRYARIDKNTYRYASNTGFSAEIVVDDLGLVITYPGGWERIASV
jgi:hypothetical protein